MSKQMIYRFLNTKLGKALFKLLPVKVTLGEKKPAKKQFLIAITVDTEAGFVRKNESRAWNTFYRDAFEGYYFGIRNWRRLAEKHDINLTFFLEPHCFAAKGHIYARIVNEMRNSIHEVGLHLHPAHDLALQAEMKQSFKATSAHKYDYKTQRKMIAAGKKLIRDHLGKDVVSFRWGNFALNTDSVKALAETGFKVDSSACPGISGHKKDDRFYDWTKARSHYPWRLSQKNYQDVKGKSRVLEIPIATFRCVGTNRADPIMDSVLIKAFNKYYENADRSEKPFTFVIMSHSSEATYRDGQPTPIMNAMEEFVLHTKQFKDVKFVTLEDAAKKY
ncbi:MAG: polysaccharide deacetylase family protein [bacterium]|nr:polysaccharide deacetylase family protein [bacterium]